MAAPATLIRATKRGQWCRANVEHWVWRELRPLFPEVTGFCDTVNCSLSCCMTSRVLSLPIP